MSSSTKRTVRLSPWLLLVAFLGYWGIVFHTGSLVGITLRSGGFAPDDELIPVLSLQLTSLSLFPVGRRSDLVTKYMPNYLLVLFGSILIIQAVLIGLLIEWDYMSELSDISSIRPN